MCNKDVLASLSRISAISTTSSLFMLKNFNILVDFSKKIIEQWLAKFLSAHAVD